MEDMAMIWNGILTLAIGSFMWWIRGVNASKDEMEKMIYETREELAKEYVSKKDFQHRTDDILNRFDKLEDKLDAFLQRVTTV